MAQKNNINKTACRLCGAILSEGNKENVYGTKHGRTHISRHHLFPRKRKWFHGLFSKEEVTQLFQINELSTCLDFCYVCHEEILHNIIFNENMIDTLSKLFKHKSEKQRVEVLHQIFKLGINEYLHKEQFENTTRCI
jgi:hypothetical protein